MARGVNKVILIGNCGRDPEVRYMPSGDAMANMTIATNESWKDRQTGEQQERTEWHNVVFFGRLAEIAGQYLRKGRPVYVEGSLRTRKWQDQNGQDRWTTEIRANEMQMLGGRDDGGSASFDAPPPRQQQAAPTAAGAAPAGAAPAASAPSTAPASKPAAAQPALDDDFDDDIPFVRSDYALSPLQNESARRLLRSNDHLVVW